MVETDKLLTLIRALLKQTLARKAGWSVGSREGTFIWSSPSGSVLVFPTDNDGQEPWSVMVLDNDGQTLEIESFSRSSSQFELADDLYKSARSSALDIDKTIDSMLEELN